MPQQTDTLSLQRDLSERLLSLNFHAFTWCMTHLLERLGYADVRLTGRTGYLGRNTQGGFDIAAKLPSALGERRVLVQVKQYGPEAMVFRRAVDALRGACLRSGASEGLMLSTGPLAPSLSASVGRSAVALPAIAPVRVVDGEELVELLMLYGIGVVGDGAGGYCLDTTYFADLEQHHPGGSREIAVRGDADRRYLLTVGVEPIRADGKHSSKARSRRFARVIL